MVRAAAAGGGRGGPRVALEAPWRGPVDGRRRRRDGGLLPCSRPDPRAAGPRAGRRLALRVRRRGAVADPARVRRLGSAVAGDVAAGAAGVPGPPLLPQGPPTLS